MNKSMFRSIAATDSLLQEVRACQLCAPMLPLGARPILQVHPHARILIAGQAPGSKVHGSGVPFDDASGNRLREWMGIDKATFYDPKRVAILPMGFCYPGTGSSGDMPPRPECAVAWRSKLLDHLPDIELTLVTGSYAQDWHLQTDNKATLTETVKTWRDHWPHIVPLPHPSPRNNIWLKRNPWFEDEVLGSLKELIGAILSKPDSH